MYDVIIIGSGISGLTIAERFGVKNKKVLVIEKRNHIGGNCYDYYNKDGLLIPKYGPHFFHTNSKRVWGYVSRFTDWHRYEHRVLSAVTNNIYVPVPVNINTVNILFNLKINSERQMRVWLENNTLKIKNPKNSEQAALRRVGKSLYEKLFKKYTIKQWDKHPRILSPEIMDRIPIRTNFDDRYFTDKYQGMPKKGYTSLFQNIAKHKNIDIALNTDYFNIDISKYKTKKSILIFTGRIDQYFSYMGYKPLEYRSLNFRYRTINKEFYQKATQINYPNSKKYTRITEPKHSTGQRHKKTTIIYEYPTWIGEGYYPVSSKQNQELYTKYQSLALKEQKKGVYFLGRLANYKYFNMDQAFENALNFYDAIT